MLVSKSLQVNFKKEINFMFFEGVFQSLKLSTLILSECSKSNSNKLKKETNVPSLLAMAKMDYSRKETTFTATNNDCFYFPNKIIYRLINLIYKIKIRNLNKQYRSKHALNQLVDKLLSVSPISSSLERMSLV